MSVRDYSGGESTNPGQRDFERMQRKFEEKPKYEQAVEKTQDLAPMGEEGWGRGPSKSEAQTEERKQSGGSMRARRPSSSARTS